MLAPPHDYLDLVCFDFPNAADYVAQHRNELTEGVTHCPEGCLLPMSSWKNLLGFLVVFDQNDSPLTNDFQLVLIETLCTWQCSRGIYQFSPHLYDQLMQAPLSTRPSSDFWNLPEYGVYTVTPGLLNGFIDGFWAHLRYFPDEDSSELLITLNTRSGPHLLRLSIGDHAINQAVEDSDYHALTAADDCGVAIDDGFRLCVNLVAHLCLQDTLIDDPLEPGAKPARAPERRVRGQLVLPRPDHDRHWRVGYQPSHKFH